MLDQLVESKSSGRENKTRGGYLLTTFVLVVGLFSSAVLWSLFAKDLGMGNGTLDVSTLVAPLAENAPAPIERRQKPEQLNNTKSAAISRQTNTLRIDENPIVPKNVSVVPNTQKSRPNGYFLVADAPETGDFQGSSATASDRSGGGDVGIQNSQPSRSETVVKVDPPPPIKEKPSEAKSKPSVVTGGVVNGKAKFLPKPIYSAAAKAVKAAGAVNVQVMIDEAGNVVSATAVDGHPLLKVEAEKAARNAKFNPTLLSKQPVKVSGVIVYKFSMQ